MILEDLIKDKPWIYELLEPVSDSLIDFLYCKFVDLYKIEFGEDIQLNEDHVRLYEKHTDTIDVLLADFYFNQQDEYVYFDECVWHLGDIEDQLEAIQNPIENPYEIFSREEFEFIKKGE